jgi:hypothetical protein
MGNSTNAYATVKPIENNMADFSVQQEQLDFQRQASRRANAAEKEKKAVADDARVQDFAKYKNLLKPYDTGSATLSTAVADAIGQVSPKFYDLYQKVNDRNLSQEERINAQAQLSDLENYPTKLKNVTDVLTNVNQTYADAVKKGDVWKNTKWESKFQNGYKTMRVGIDEKNNPVMLFFDGDGDGINDGLTYEEIVNLVPEDIMIPKIDGLKLAETYAKGLKKREDETYDINDPYKKTTTTGVLDEELRAGARQIMTPEFLASEKMKLERTEDFSETELTAMEQELVDVMKPYTERGVKNEYDISAKNAKANADASLAQRRKEAAEKLAFDKKKQGDLNKDRGAKNAIAKAKANGKKVTEKVSIGDVSKTTITKEDMGSIPKGSKNFNNSNGGPSIYLHPDNKNISFRVYEEEKDENGIMQEKIIEINSNNLTGTKGVDYGNFLKSMEKEDGSSYNNTQELIDDLLLIETGEYKPKATTTTTKGSTTTKGTIQGGSVR